MRSRVVRRLAVAGFAALLALVSSSGACSDPDTQPNRVVIHIPVDLAWGATAAVDDLEADLGALTGLMVTREALPAPACRAGQLHVAVLGHEHDAGGERAATELGPQEYEITEQRCGDGHVVTVRGGSLLAGQWAAYELMEQLGVRYFHPEASYVPDGPRWPAAPLAVRERPDLGRRSMHAHRTHPIELSPPLDAAGLDMAAYQRRWIAWNIKLRQTELDGWDAALVGTYAYDRGFPRSAGFNLLNSQQGGRPVLDPDDPRPESEQLAEAIDEQMAPIDGQPPVSRFGFQFNPSEFTVADEQLTVDRLTFITDYLAARWPEVEVRTINHGTGQPPGPTFGVRFFDLPALAPPRLAVQVHPLMFYDLERPAPVYGNQDFTFLRDWIVAQQAVRRIHYYPESSWWLTFDLPVPLYLAPVTLEARDRDLQLLRPYVPAAHDAPTGVVGHHLFTSGQEWGYWMIDYCTARMTWDLDLGWLGCLDHVTAAFAGGAELRALLEEVGRAQVAPLRDPAILRMLVGSDDETEAAALAGIVFHPLPPPPAAMLSWTDEQVASFRLASLQPMPAMAEQYAGWAQRAQVLAAQQAPAQAPWVEEIADALRVTGLRAAHAWEVYDATLALRAAIVTSDFEQVAAAAARVERARGLTAEARAVIQAREAAYRYPPELTIEGDEPGTSGAVPNQTIYPYRYLSRTHRMFFWQRPDDQLAAMVGADLERVTVNDRILPAGTALDVGLLVEKITQLAIDWGDGQTAAALAPHLYAAQGFYDWIVDVVHAGGALHHVDRVAIVERRYAFALGSLQITAPAGAELIEGLLPGLVLGTGGDGSGAFLALGRVDGDTAVVTRGTLVRRGRSGATSGPEDLRMELARVGAATVHGAVLTLADGSGAMDRRLTITGELSTDEIIQLLVDTGGFDEPGARAIVATTLGFTVDTLPARVAFTIEAVGRE